MSQHFNLLNKRNGMYRFTFIPNNLSMLAEYYFVILVLFGLAASVFILFFISYERPSEHIPAQDKQNVAARIVPFIAAHQSLVIEPEQQNNAIAREALK